MEFIAFFLILGSILWLFYRKSNLTTCQAHLKIPYFNRTAKKIIAICKKAEYYFIQAVKLREELR